MIINRFPIPEVLVDIIKDYIYYNKTQVIQRYLKNILNETINNLYVSHGHSLNVQGEIKISYFDVVSHDSTFTLHSSVCSTCGEYCFNHANIFRLGYTRCCNYIENESLYYYSDIEFDLESIQQYTPNSDNNSDYWNHISYANEITDGSEFSNTFE